MKKTKILVLILVLASLIVAPIFAAGGEETDDNLQFMYISSLLSHFLQKGIADWASVRAEELGVELEVVSYELDVNEMFSLLDLAVTKQVDGVGLCTISETGATPYIERFNELGIPVVTVNPKPEGGDYGSGASPEFLFVGADTREVGRINSTWMAEHLPPNAKICQMTGGAGQVDTINFQTSFEEVMSSMRPDVEIVSTLPGDWLRDKALEVAETWMQQYPDIDGIYVADSEMALGVVEAVKAAGRSGEVMIVTYGDPMEALEAVKSGDITYLISAGAQPNGENLMQALYDMATGSEMGVDIFPEEYALTYEAVTIDNVQEFIDRAK